MLFGLDGRDARQHTSRSGSAAFLIFLAASARAGIVASNFCSRAYDLLDLQVTSPGHARLFQFFLFLALEGLFDIVYGCCDLARRASVTPSATGDDLRL